MDNTLQPNPTEIPKRVRINSAQDTTHTPSAITSSSYPPPPQPFQSYYSFPPPFYYPPYHLHSASLPHPPSSSMGSNSVTEPDRHPPSLSLPQAAPPPNVSPQDPQFSHTDWDRWMWQAQPMARWEAYQERNADAARSEQDYKFIQNHWINAFDHRQGICLVCNEHNCSSKNGRSSVCPRFQNLCINDIALLEPQECKLEQCAKRGTLCPELVKLVKRATQESGWTKRRRNNNPPLTVDPSRPPNPLTVNSFWKRMSEHDLFNIFGYGPDNDATPSPGLDLTPTASTPSSLQMVPPTPCIHSLSASHTPSASVICSTTSSRDTQIHANTTSRPFPSTSLCYPITTVDDDGNSVSDNVPAAVPRGNGALGPKETSTIHSISIPSRDNACGLFPSHISLSCLLHNRAQPADASDYDASRLHPDAFSVDPDAAYDEDPFDEDLFDDDLHHPVLFNFHTFDLPPDIHVHMAAIDSLITSHDILSPSTISSTSLPLPSTSWLPGLSNNTAHHYEQTSPEHNLHNLVLPSSDSTLVTPPQSIELRQTIHLLEQQAELLQDSQIVSRLRRASHLIGQALTFSPNLCSIPLEHHQPLITAHVHALAQRSFLSARAQVDPGANISVETDSTRLHDFTPLSASTVTLLDDSKLQCLGVGYMHV